MPIKEWADITDSTAFITAIIHTDLRLSPVDLFYLLTRLKSFEQDPTIDQNQYAQALNILNTATKAAPPKTSCSLPLRNPD